MYGATPLAYPTHFRATAGGFHYAMGRLGAIMAAVTDGVSFQGKMAIYITANVLAGAAPFFFRDFKTNEENLLKSDQQASVQERREGSLLKKESRSRLLEKPAPKGTCALM